MTEFEDRLWDLCVPHSRAKSANPKPHECDFVKLVNELLDLLLAKELFTFVLEPAVEPTNNLTERLHRKRRPGSQSGTHGKQDGGRPPADGPSLPASWSRCWPIWKSSACRACWR